MEQARQAGDIDKEKIGAQGDVDVTKIGASGDQAVRQIGAQGDSDRSTLSQATRETAKDRANQRQYSRELAAR